MTRQPQTARCRPTRRPRLEALEDRCLLSAGDLDPTFGTGGLVVTAITNPGNDSANDLVIQPDGKVLAVGSSGNNFALVRYNPNGTRDATFGANGVVTTDFKGADGATAVALLADGKILAAGYSQTNTGGIFRGKLALARYLPNGTLDNTFGARGTVTTDLGSGSSDSISAVAIQADGKIVVAGKTNSFPDGDNFLVARYTVSGRLDSTFGSGGVTYTDFQAALSADAASGMAIQSDGKLIVVGKTTAVGTGADQFAVARYHTNGTLDASFGTGGTLTTLIGSWSQATDVRLLADGRILVGGSSDGNYAVARYLADGSLDPTFGLGGVSTGLEVPEGYFWGTGMALQANGKILVAARVSMVDGSDNVGLVRLNGDGSLDTTFGAGGAVTTDFHPSVALNFDGAAAVAVQADGKIVVAGSTRGGTGSGLIDFALARYEGDAPLLAASVALRPGPRPEGLTAAAVQPLLGEALRRWQAGGMAVEVRITDLGGTVLGMTDGNVVWLDADAAGWGWFIDATPADDSEFTTPGDQGEQGRIDLLSVLMHEMGHLLGHDHDDKGVMQEMLAPGSRLLPEAIQDQADIVTALAVSSGNAFGWWDVARLLQEKE